MGLTLTRVVFECEDKIKVLDLKFRLTLTRVVFEYAFIFKVRYRMFD